MPPTKATNVDEYIAEQQNALARNPECANTHYNLGVGYLSKRMFREAEESLIKALDCSPKLVEAYVQLGGIAMQRGDLETCLRYNQMAVRERPFFAVPHANIGFVHMQRGEADQAIAAFKKAVAQDPKFVQAMANLGGVYYMKGMLDAAENWCKKALAVEPKFGPAYHNLAMVALERGDKATATANVEKARESGYDIPQKLIDDIAALP
ncbi:Tetratricopeptide TPR_1 repeat-containing protein [Alkalidesulfovibrio alkalitolerans DSM 16529]|jgi:Tfp pilus assembly protein PilF|uniref:Tetratricopeptide TPR_1 repeat-containing protein n=1 Tax=Alkalidesulfovibrio alkalitolerans DSM 16529 TaxID=1121439 RepID=S7TG17_9BACT|nr:tetratricopeptide repeat protein [Alkalidesulfovibrio alkalitolerans]EPR36162.1 Tetratricopeptide TPR_1 repeat-containing protein [Alkalidesulfovibrio alkalitolerans DSM 16529]